MKLKHWLLVVGSAFICAVPITLLSSVVFESEPSYDYFRDGGSPPALGIEKYPTLEKITPENKHVTFTTHKNEKVIVVNPRTHAWYAYGSDGKLVRTGLASAGSSWCSDLGRPCRTKSGTFRIYSLGDEDCISKKFPLGEGGAPMPYCMYFNGGQALHGSHELAYANISHGCVRITVSSAKWLRFHFAEIGTKVIIKPY